MGKMEGLGEGGESGLKNATDGGRTLKETKEMGGGRLKANSRQLSLQMAFMCRVRSAWKKTNSKRYNRRIMQPGLLRRG